VLSSVDWVGVGFGKTPTMHDADYAMAVAQTDGTFDISDRVARAVRPAAWASDAQLGVADWATGHQETAGHTDVNWPRPTGEGYCARRHRRPAGRAGHGAPASRTGTETRPALLSGPSSRRRCPGTAPATCGWWHHVGLYPQVRDGRQRKRHAHRAEPGYSHGCTDQFPAATAHRDWARRAG